MVSLTFYGGAGEIGGNKILLEDKGARIYLDFGESFNFGEDYFYEYLSPRAVNGLEVYFEFGLLPKVPRLYGKRQLQFTGMKYAPPDIDAVFISHFHSDHLNHLPFLDEGIPVYMGHGTQRLIETYNKLYPGYYKMGEHKEIGLFKSGDKIKVKHLVVEPIHVEHSVPGAYGFIIHTSKGAVVYTGDFRLHGPRSDMSQEFVEKAADARPYAMLCEGTRMAEAGERNYTEKEVEEKADEIIKEAKGIVFADFSMANVDRFLSFYNATVKNGRKLVIDTRFAFVLDNLREKVAALPDVMEDKDILVYYRIAKSCEFEEKDYYPWERKYFPKKVTYKELSRAGKGYVMHMGFNKLMELVYIQPKDAEFVYSMSEHFLEGEENEEMRTVMENWVKHFKVGFHKAHSSGHASREDLEEVVKKVNPKVLVPMHTSKPEEFLKLHKNVVLPEKGKTIEI